MEHILVKDNKIEVLNRIRDFVLNKDVLLWFNLDVDNVENFDYNITLTHEDKNGNIVEVTEDSRKVCRNMSSRFANTIFDALILEFGEDGAVVITGDNEVYFGDDRIVIKQPWYSSDHQNICYTIKVLNQGDDITGIPVVINEFDSDYIGSTNCNY